MMKKIFITLAATMLSLCAWAQNEVAFEFSDGISDMDVKNTMERNVSRLLTAINVAESSKKDINYSGIGIDNLASQSIGMMWNNVHFRVVDDDIVEHCLRLKAGGGRVVGYEVRNIAVEMRPFDNSYEGDRNQEVSITFDPTGRITDFNLTIGLQQYTQLMKEGERLEDLDRRMQILHWVEQFRNAYCQKDIQFMENVFSEDALIITGKVVKREHTDMRPRTDVEYTRQSKEQYMKNLRRVFKGNTYINVHFDEITIKRHGSKPNFYGVTLKQGWRSDRYHDEGIVFIVWDFTNELNPKILVRTWQPVDDNWEPVGGKGVYTLSDFKLN